MITPNWIENGEGARGLVFLHGVSGGAAGALELLPRLAAPGWRTLAWDMPGYGASEAFEADTPEGMGAYADALAELLDAAGLERAVLVGHSMGGMVALQTAAAHPERVAGLVLACCTPAFGASAGAMQQAFLDKRLGPLDEGASMRELAIDLIPGMVGPGGEAELVHDAVNLMEQIPPDSYRRALRAVVGFDQRSALARIAVPALVIAGTHDKVSTPLVVRRMAERLPAGVYREIDAGHLAPFEEPAIFTALVREFLDGLDHIPVI